MSYQQLPPPLKHGWLKKQGRGGFVKNWKKRYFVLNLGKIFYYEQEDNKPPYGIGLKGEMSLFNAKVIKDKTKNENQIYLEADSIGEEKNMLIEANTNNLATEWYESLLEHSSYATKIRLSTMDITNKSMISMKNNSRISNGISPNGSSLSINDSSSSRVSRNPSVPRNTSTNSSIEESDYNTLLDDNQSRSHAINDLQSNSQLDSPLPSSEQEFNLVTPKPGFVIKVIRKNKGEKIFVNFCEHGDIPHAPIALGYNKWPFMVMSTVRTMEEKKDNSSSNNREGSTIWVYDAVVHPSVMTLCSKDPVAKDNACQRVVGLLRKTYGEELESNEYKLPKITKKYKGEVIPVKIPVHLDAHGHFMPQYNKTKPPKVTTTANNSTGSGGNSTATGGSTPVPVGFGRQMSESSYLTGGGSSLPNDDLKSDAGGPASSQDTSIAAKLFDQVSENDRRRLNVRQNVADRIPLLDINTSAPTASTSASTRPTFARMHTELNVGVATEDKKSLNLSSSATYSESDPSSPNAPPMNPKALRGVLNAVGKFKKKPVMSRASVSGDCPSDSMSQSTTPFRDSTGQIGLASNKNRKIRRYIPYNIIRSAGTVAKEQPDKNANGRILGAGSRVFVIARKVMNDGIAWLKTTEGWVMERVYTGGMSRILTPVVFGQPVGARIVTTRFEDNPNKRPNMLTHCYSMKGGGGMDHPRQSASGWFVFQSSNSVSTSATHGHVPDSFQTRFLIDIEYPDSAVIKISRTYHELSTLRTTMLNFSGDRIVRDRALHAGDFPMIQDGDESMLVDVKELLLVVESSEKWLNTLITSISVERCKCKALLEFITPRENDCMLMELELMAQGGMEGCWEGDL